MEKNHLRVQKVKEKSSKAREKRTARPHQSHSPRSDACTSEVVLPEPTRERLYELFGQIEKEFGILYNENLAMQQKISSLSARLESVNQDRSDSADVGGAPDTVRGMVSRKASETMSQMFKSYKASTSKIVSTLMPNNVTTMVCNSTRTLTGHRDGVWDVHSTRTAIGGVSLVGSASADRSARVWNVETGNCILSYVGHSGSVNCISFHPKDTLACTASGDGLCHIWKYQLSAGFDAKPLVVTNEDHEKQDDEQDASGPVKVKLPIMELKRHEGPVSSACWMHDNHVVTSSWDRLSKIWDVETGAAVNTISGHDSELTYVDAHPSQKMLLTSSADFTFRLWDFRTSSVHAVNVFQRHLATVNSAKFASKVELVISSSDDHTVKIWDLRKMMTPIETLRFSAAVNRVGVSSAHNWVAIPLDNCAVHLYEPSTCRLSRLRRRGESHNKTVCSICWVDDSTAKSCSMASAGFDNKVVLWNVGMQ